MQNLEQTSTPMAINSDRNISSESPAPTKTKRFAALAAAKLISSIQKREKRRRNDDDDDMY